jgi:hypothetical protein
MNFDDYKKPIEWIRANTILIWHQYGYPFGGEIPDFGMAVGEAKSFAHAQVPAIWELHTEITKEDNETYSVVYTCYDSANKLIYSQNKAVEFTTEKHAIAYAYAYYREMKPFYIEGHNKPLMTYARTGIACEPDYLHDNHMNLTSKYGVKIPRCKDIK